MHYIKQRVKNLAMILPGLVLMLSLLSFYGGAVVHAIPATIPVTGTVTDPDGNPLGNVRVTATSVADGSVADNTITYSENSFPTVKPFGSYELDVPAGTYNIVFQSEDTLSLWNDITESNVAVGAATTLNEQLSSSNAKHVLHGSVKDGNNNPVVGMDISLAGNPGVVTYTKTDASGNYAMTVPDTHYYLTGFGITVSNPGFPQKFVYDDHDAINISGADYTENLQLPGTVKLNVLVKDKSGNPDPGQRVVLGTYAVTGNDVQNPYILEEYDTVTTDANGIAVLPVWQGYDVGDYSSTPVVDFTSDNLIANNPTTPLPMNSDTTIEIDEANGHPYIFNAPVLSANVVNGYATLQWTSITNATSYIVIRDPQTSNATNFHVNAPTTTFTDTTANPGQHSYLVYAWNNPLAGPKSNIVTVTSTGQPVTQPTITYSTDATPNAAGWNNTPVTVTYDCEAGAGIASCTSPQTLATDGANQTSTGTVVDSTGSTASVTTDPINIDTTPPSVSNFTLTHKTVAQAESFSVTTSDATSGVAGGEFYYGTDPGQGNGTPMSYDGSQLSGTLDATLPVGTYQIYVRSHDIAGNWSSPVSAKLVVTQAGLTGVTASGSYTPSLAHGDQLPGLGTNSYNLAQYNSNITFNTNGITNGSSLSFTYKYGSTVLCGAFPTLPGCHQATMTASGTNFSSIAFSGTNNANVTITGTLNVTVDGVTTNNPFRLNLYSAAKGGSGTNSYDLSVYTPGSAMDSTSLLYHAVNSGTVVVR